MKLAIRQPDFSSAKWAELPEAHRTEIRAILAACEVPPAPGVKLTDWLADTALSLGITHGRFKDKYYALRNSGGDWTVLIDHRKADTMPAEAATTKSPRFIAFLLTLVESYQRKNSPAFKELRRRWRVRDQIIPGYEGWPGWPQIPAGWSARNLADIVKAATNKAALRSIRVGTSSKTNSFLPHIITTRVGLWPGAIIQLDDVWHDNYVTLGRKREICRVLELGALDVFSGHRFHWGAKPRRRRENGSWENIAAKDMRLFLAGMLHRFGACPQGMQFMSEHQTAKVDEDIARTLYDSSRGMIRVEYQPIEGKQAALSGYWHGTEGGNFRAKACLESTHALIHNDLSRLALQTGSPSSGLKGPVTTDRIIAYIARILKKVQEHVPHRLDLLKLPALDFHSQFIPFLTDYYQFGLSMRTDHELEGWHALEHFITEYTLLPGSDQWIGEDTFLALPHASQTALSAAVQQAPKEWTRRRALSPLEVFSRKPAWNPVAATVLCDIVGQDLRRECTARRGFIEFSDQDISADPLVYQARYCRGPRAGQEIPHGEKVSLVVFPFDDATTAIAVDAKGRVLGELPLYKRVQPINPAAFGSTAPYDVRPDIRSEALIRAAGEKHERIADILEPVRIRHTEEVQEARETRAEWNRIADPRAAVTPEEISAARSTAAHQAAATRLANKVAAHAASVESVAALDAWAEPAHFADQDLSDPDSSPEFNPFTD